MTEPALLIVTALAGLAAGVINVLAGGGSLLVLPALALAGVPPGAAIGTIRIGIIGQNLAATLRYHRAGVIPWAEIRRISPVVVVSALIGALASVNTSHESLGGWVQGTALVAGGLVLMNPGFVGKSRGMLNGRALPLGLVLMGLWGGFLQAGVGYVILATLVFLGGERLEAANVKKVVLVLLYTPFTLVVFWSHDRLAWGPAGVLLLSQGLGAWLGARLALKGGSRVVRWALAFALVSGAIAMALA